MISAKISLPVASQSKLEEAIPKTNIELSKYFIMIMIMNIHIILTNIKCNEYYLVLGITDLDTVCDNFRKRGFQETSWQSIGLDLGLYWSTLEVIDKKHRGDPSECLQECLASWLRLQDKVKEKGGANWTTLFNALKNIG